MNGSMFHTQDGLYFGRLPNGDVRIVKTDDNRDPESTDTQKILDMVIPGNSWASVIASVSAGGEVDERWYPAVDFHNSTGKIKVESCG